MSAGPDAATAATAAPGPRRWIVSAPVDLAMVGLPFLLGALLVAAPQEGPGGGTPLWAFLFLIVAFDVAHVWATLYISYLEPGAVRRRPLLFLLPVPLAFLAAFRLHQHSPVLFWSLLAYVAIHHFASQHYGFVALYKLRGRERSRFDKSLDKLTLWTGALGPVLLWHTEAATRSFDWFGHGEAFLLTVDPALRPDILAVMALVGTLYAGRQVALSLQGRFNWGKNLWMLAAWVSWSVGLAVVSHPLVSLALINLLHGIPFLILVWRRCAVGRDPAAGGVVSWLSQPQRLWAFYGVLLLLALAEEGLWDGLVWGGAYLGTRAELSPTATSLAVAALATPQIVHYILDAFLWKLDGTNPGLERMLGVERKPPSDPPPLR